MYIFIQVNISGLLIRLQNRSILRQILDLYIIIRQVGVMMEVNAEDRYIKCYIVCSVPEELIL